MRCADHRRSISFTVTFMLYKYFLVATLGVIEDEKKDRLRLPRMGPPPEIGVSVEKILRSVDRAAT